MKILRLPEVCDAAGFGPSFIYELVAKGEFPAPVKIGVRSVGWLENEVNDWIASRPRAEPGTSGAGGAATKRGKTERRTAA